ncbi:hypothetical protein LCGC14_1478360 [marine sediment metagenome]|uniref:Uncharacterized protein n=1 Tax=marine sediment metagenome TaxID=412755 RepID=A0A0F9JAA2_9ZZZZ|nr:hypothetical protein [bacterium]
MEKKSFNIKTLPWATIGAGLAVSIIGSTVAAFADTMLEWFKENKSKSKGKEYYIEMLKAHPSLKKEDPKVVAQYWASLFHFAPHMAADPLSAGAFIRQSIARGFPEQFGGPPIDTYSALTGINKSIADIKESKRRFSEIATSAASKVVGRGYEDIAGYRRE